MHCIRRALHVRSSEIARLPLQILNALQDRNGTRFIERKYRIRGVGGIARMCNPREMFRRILFALQEKKTMF